MAHEDARNKWPFTDAEMASCCLARLTRAGRCDPCRCTERNAHRGDLQADGGRLRSRLVHGAALEAARGALRWSGTRAATSRMMSTAAVPMMLSSGRVESVRLPGAALEVFLGPTKCPLDSP